MIPEYYFLGFFIFGTILGIALYKYKESQKKKEFKIIEMELVNNLKELKTYIEPDENKIFSDEYDLVEIALEYGLEDIIITNDEGFIVASTLKDSEELGSNVFKIFCNVKDLYNNLKKIIIQEENSNIIIYPIRCCDENLYIIIVTKKLPSHLDEKEIYNRVYTLLKDKYLKVVRNIDNLPTKTPLKDIEILNESSPIKNIENI